MIKKLKFVKLAYEWFVHLPNYDLGGPEDLLMVEGADNLCDAFDTDCDGIVDIDVSDDENAFMLYTHLEFTRSTTLGNEVGGAYYSVNGGDEIWLCNVVKYVFDGQFPSDIYIKNNL